jgi:hypothetical protein
MLYIFKKIIINKIFRMTLKPSWNNNQTSVFKNFGSINFGGDFQQKYSLITFVNQSKGKFQMLYLEMILLA